MATKISELPTTQKVGNILDETLNVGGGATTATTATVTIPRTTATTNTVEPLIAFNRQSSGTPANGIGASLVFDVETAAGNTERGATIEAVATDVTGGSEGFNLVVKLMQAGAAASTAMTLTSIGNITVPGSIMATTGNITAGNVLVGAAGVYLSLAADTALVRSAAGVARVFTGSATGSLLAKTLVEANTAGSGSPNILTEAESGTLLTNEGASAQNYHTLPTAVAGLVFEFIVQDADGIRVVAAAGDTIQDVGTVSAAAGYIQSTTIGSAIRMVAINATQWVVTSKQGTWTIDS